MPITIFIGGDNDPRRVVGHKCPDSCDLLVDPGNLLEVNMRKRIYVAGKFTDDDILDIFENMRLGTKYCSWLFSQGYAPFCPWLDHAYILVGKRNEYKVSEFYDYSLAWLAVSDEVKVLPNWEGSKGTKKEIEVAKELNIPVTFLTWDEIDAIMELI